VRWTAEQGGGVWTIDAAGGAPRPAGPQGAYWSEPLWDRDGKA
jgi:hypothetical protein